MIFSSVLTFILAIVTVSIIINILIFFVFWSFFIGLKMKMVKRKALKEIEKGIFNPKEPEEVQELPSTYANDYYKPAFKPLPKPLSAYQNPPQNSQKQVKGGNGYGIQKERAREEGRYREEYRGNTGGVKEVPRRADILPTARDNFQSSSYEQVDNKGNIDNQRRNKPIRWNPI